MNFMAERNKVDILAIRKRLDPVLWRPAKPYGDEGWIIDDVLGTQRIIVSYHGVWDGAEWVHASISNREADRGLPGWADTSYLHRAVWGEGGWSYEVHPPQANHVNIHPRALHLWGRLDGKPALPDFAPNGTI